jgi:hypothetical protein
MWPNVLVEYKFINYGLIVDDLATSSALKIVKELSSKDLLFLFINENKSFFAASIPISLEGCLIVDRLGEM